MSDMVDKMEQKILGVVILAEYMSQFPISDDEFTVENTRYTYALALYNCDAKFHTKVCSIVAVIMEVIINELREEADYEGKR